MIAGRKLLLADDSVAIQKVIDLTFSDEGMEVTTVGDGQDALEKLNQFTPDVVLADVYMPGVGGYELCKFIKQNERFRGVPVMLLVGSFEPFDEAEARRAGADDVVTKPFQSIRDLVSRVGSLVSRDDASTHSVLGLNETEDSESIEEVPVHVADVSAADAERTEQPAVKVFVEAPVMEVAEDSARQEHMCPPDIGVQTADTQQLEPILKPSAEIADADFVDTIELEVVGVAERDATEAVVFENDGVLDLGDIDGLAAAPVDDEFELDIDVEPVTTLVAKDSEAIAERETRFESIDAQQPVAETRKTPSGSSSAEGTVEASTPTPGLVQDKASDAGLSPEAIDAISRRVVEHLSDKVVREIAWEVVPELSELLIKKQLKKRD